jgi:hypothetical protein
MVRPQDERMEMKGDSSESDVRVYERSLKQPELEPELR